MATLINIEKKHLSKTLLILQIHASIFYLQLCRRSRSLDSSGVSPFLHDDPHTARAVESSERDASSPASGLLSDINLTGKEKKKTQSNQSKKKLKIISQKCSQYSYTD